MWTHKVQASVPGIFVLLLLAGSPGWAQQPTRPLTKGAPITIPVEIVDNLVYMPGRINRSPQLSVILDTGCSISIVEPAVALKNGLLPSGSAEAAGIGQGGDQTLRFVDGVRLQWGPASSGLAIEGQKIAILSIGEMAEQIGRATDASFGNNVFHNFRVRVDYQNQRVTFASPATSFSVRGRPIPIKIIDGTPYVTATVSDAHGFRAKGTFLLDSGTTGSLVLNERYLALHPRLIAGRRSVDVPSVKVVGGRLDLKLVRIAELDLGPFHFEQPVAAVPQSNVGVLAGDDVAGFIGAGILSRFTVTWDYAHRRMWLVPNSHWKDPFEGDASGLRLSASGPDYKTIRIAAVLSGSPADDAGLRVGDVITSFNGDRDSRLWQIVQAMQKPGAKVTLSIQRGTKEWTAFLHLQRLV